ncbi:MAG: hypothetical protein E6G44_02435 [Actinobacteria bacterium]|nr:MAG: hypothetical protein E6G44_02435 [Actinomycetota bacterium]
MDELERALTRLLASKVEEAGIAPSPPPAPVLRRIKWRQFFTALTTGVVVAALAFGSLAGVRVVRDLTAKAATHPAAHRGGSLVVGTREFPECLNPLTGCASATGTWWTVLQHVMPRAMELDSRGDFVPSPLLAGAPSIQAAGNGFTITYRLDPKATWADGSPITSADFAFTWRAIMNTSGSDPTAGYDRIASIDTSRPKTVVISFKARYADWPDLFGGVAGGILERAAFPRYANDPTPDLANEMQRDIPFSGGPWILKSFSLGKIVLTRNDRYFGKHALLDQVTIVALTDASGAARLLMGGTIDAFPWPGEEDFLDRFSGHSNVRAIAASGFGFEALWFNHSSPPLDDPKVREALMYAIDRQAVIDQVMSHVDPQARILDCGFLAAPAMGPWCHSTPFDRFTYDPEKAKRILESDGYDCSHLPCTKGRKKLVVEYSTVSTNERRLRIQQLLKGRALPAGFVFLIKNFDSGVLFDHIGPRGLFTMAEYSSEVAPDPSVTREFGCENIPVQRTGFTGDNWIHWCNQNANDLMHRSDRTLQVEQRIQLMDEIYRLEARDFISIPLYVEPEMAAWRTDRIAGPIGEFAGSQEGLFFNMNEWYRAGR